MYVGKNSGYYTDYLLALIGGAVATMGMPGFLSPLLIPLGMWALIYTLRDKTPKRAGGIGVVFGLSHFGLMLWWLVPTISRYGQLPFWAAMPVVGLLVVYLAFYIGLWAFLYRLPGSSPSICMALWGSALWALIEWLRGIAFTGFPWGILALGLNDYPILIQVADIFSIYGVSAFFCLLILLGYYFLALISKGLNKEAIKVGGIILLVLCVIIVYGRHNINKFKETEAQDEKSLCLVAVQGAIPQSYKWDPAIREKTLKTYFDLTDTGITGCEDDGARVVTVWPETAVTTYIEYDYDTFYKISHFVKDRGISILFGAPSYDVMPKTRRPIFYNSAYLMDKDGMVLGRYDKRHLVPFGEYMPLGPFSKVARKYLPTAGDFEAGHSGGVLRATTGLKIGVLICFESIFPSLARQSVLEGAQLLAVITNDAWFGRTQAPFQHEAMSVFRAIETRRWVVRAANTGISSIIAPTGRRLAITHLFVPDVIEAQGHANSVRSIFVRFGQSGFLTLVLLLLMPILIQMLKGILFKTKKE